MSHISHAKLTGLCPIGTSNDGNGTVSSTAVAATTILAAATIPDNAPWVLVSVMGAHVRVTFDGSTPTTSNGHLYYDGEREVWTKAAWLAAKLVRSASTDVEVHATPMAFA